MYNSQLVSSRISELLQANGKQKKELNDYCGINKSTINQSANSQNGLSAKTLYDCADFFNCSVDYLLGRTDTPDAYSGSAEQPNVTDCPQFSQDDIDFLKLAKQLPLIERSRLICEMINRVKAANTII